jgi:hypothetical protein
MERTIGIRLLIAAMLFLNCGLGTAQTQGRQNPYMDGQDDGKPKARYIVVPPKPATKHAKPGYSLTTWEGAFNYNSYPYFYTMVGTDPLSTNVTTEIGAVVIPVKLVYPGNTFDPTADKFAGTDSQCSRRYSSPRYWT